MSWWETAFVLGDTVFAVKGKGPYHLKVIRGEIKQISLDYDENGNVSIRYAIRHFVDGDYLVSAYTESNVYGDIPSLLERIKEELERGGSS